MRDLQIEQSALETWFLLDQGGADDVLIVRTPEHVAVTWDTTLVDGARRCYASDSFLASRALAVDKSQREILAALLPDRGSVMAGDFGEILSFVFLGARNAGAVGPKKWRLKQDRTKPAPGSDVVQFVVPDWPNASDRDRVVCAEVKTKSTDGATMPIASAIADSKKDRLGRLAKTLAWLEARALLQDLGSTSLAQIQRFLHAADHPPARREYWAVAVVAASLLKEALDEIPEPVPVDVSLAVLSVPDLKARYESAFDAMLSSVPG